MATGPFSDAVLTEYASVTGFSKADCRTDEGYSIEASSPAKLDGKGMELGELRDLQVQISLEAKEPSTEQLMEIKT